MKINLVPADGIITAFDQHRTERSAHRKIIHIGFPRGTVGKDEIRIGKWHNISHPVCGRCPIAICAATIPFTHQDLRQHHIVVVGATLVGDAKEIRANGEQTAFTQAVEGTDGCIGTIVGDNRERVTHGWRVSQCNIKIAGEFDGTVDGQLIVAAAGRGSVQFHLEVGSAGVAEPCVPQRQDARRGAGARIEVAVNIGLLASTGPRNRTRSR